MAVHERLRASTAALPFSPNPSTETGAVAPPPNGTEHPASFDGPTCLKDYKTMQDPMAEHGERLTTETVTNENQDGAAAFATPVPLGGSAADPRPAAPSLLVFPRERAVALQKSTTSDDKYQEVSTKTGEEEQGSEAAWEEQEETEIEGEEAYDILLVRKGIHLVMCLTRGSDQISDRIGSDQIRSDELTDRTVPITSAL